MIGGSASLTHPPAGLKKSATEPTLTDRPISETRATSPMGLVEKIMRSGAPADAEEGASVSLADGALDTLGVIFRTMGEASFPTDKDADTEAFLASCAAFARHVEQGAAVPAADIEQSPDGQRDWSQVRRFYVDRRHSERDFVTERLDAYRSLVEDLVSGLRTIGERDDATESTVIRCLRDIQEAIAKDGLAEAQEAVNEAVGRVSHTFSQQRQAYEQQISELNERLASLRQDLVAAREEMQRDSLTDLFNRGAFDQGLEHSINLNFISNQPVTLALIDLDHFKTINDTCGHAAGDNVLKAVAETLSRTFIRKSDLVCRYGGDEFAVILNDTSADNTTPLLQRFLKALTRIEVSATGHIPVGCSIGYTEVIPGDDVVSVVERADQGLYAAKAAGRNCARLIEPLSQEGS